MLLTMSWLPNVDDIEDATVWLQSSEGLSFILDSAIESPGCTDADNAEVLVSSFEEG